MVHETSIIYHMTKARKFRPGFLPDVDISLEEIYTDGMTEDRFKHLQITVKVSQDDPRLKALDIYTQYSGVHTLLIKHAPRTIDPGSKEFYRAFRLFDDQQDECLDSEDDQVNTYIWPTSYAVATGLEAESLIHEGEPEGEIKIGMVQGNETGKEENPYNTGEYLTRVPLGTVGSPDVTFALDSNNSLCEKTFIFTDPHPIPFASYCVWGYFNDTFDWTPPLNMAPIGLASQIYQPNHLLVGKIIKVEEESGFDPGYYYIIRYVTQIFPVLLFNTLRTQKHLLEYPVGRWVLLQKDKERKWYIVTSSSHYWKDAVDYFRKLPGVT